ILVELVLHDEPRELREALVEVRAAEEEVDLARHERRVGRVELALQRVVEERREREVAGEHDDREDDQGDLDEAGLEAHAAGGAVLGAETGSFDTLRCRGSGSEAGMDLDWTMEGRSSSAGLDLVAKNPRI